MKKGEFNRVADSKELFAANDRKAKALRKIIRALKPIASGDYVINDIINIAEKGLKMPKDAWIE